MFASLVLHDMDRYWFASYRFRLWMLQDFDQPYEIVLCLFNDECRRFETLTRGGNPAARPLIKSHPRPRSFNISAANNVGLHHAGGEYVLFANSDFVYPSHFLRTFVGELRRRGIQYALASRVELSREQTAALPGVAAVRAGSGFDFLVGCEHLPGRRIVADIAPWTVRREIALRVGGFDPRILCHLSHPPSELYDASAAAQAILVPRRLRLRQDPGSEEDVLAMPLHSQSDLIADLLATTPPPAAPRETTVRSPRSLARSALRRGRLAWKALTRG